MTPFPGVRAEIARLSRKRRGEILVSLNKRDARYPDLYRVDLASGALTLVAENPGYSDFITDDNFNPKLATKSTEDGGEEVLRADAKGGWEQWFKISPEDNLNTGIIGLNGDGTAIFINDSRGRNTTALARIDLKSGAESILAEDSRADVASAIADLDTYEPLAYGVNYEQQRIQSAKP